MFYVLERSWLMDVNLELVKRIISSDELCDKVNSGDNSEVYIKQIHDYVFSLVDINANSNIDYINRYLRKFVLHKNKEDIFFDKILLKCYSLNVKNPNFLEILSSFNFDGIKEILIKKYNEYIINKTKVSSDELIKMLSLYCYTCPNYIFPISYINYFTYYLYFCQGKIVTLSNIFNFTCIFSFKLINFNTPFLKIFFICGNLILDIMKG